MNILRYSFLVLVLLLSACASQQAPQTTASGYAPDASSAIDLTRAPRDMWERIRRGFAVPNLQNERVQHWTDYYASHPESVLLMSQRAGKYLYYIVDELDRRGMPTELALLPFVESAYNPQALSRSKASGLWQFIPSTGLHYNLQQDRWRDQRRDPVASTQAALEYLSYLYDFQGDWHLALASYNWGEGAVRRAMERAENKGVQPSYATIDMPDETRNYVPKLQAIKNIIAQPEKFGISLPPVSNTPYFTSIQKSTDIDVAVAATLAEMPLEEFEALNPSYNRAVILAQHKPALHLPLDKVGVFDRNFQSYSANPAPLQAQASKNTPGQAAPASGRQLVQVRAAPATQAVVRTHTIKKGDTLFSLAKRYKTSVDQLRKINNIRGSKLSLGQRLRIPGANTPA